MRKFWVASNQAGIYAVFAHMLHHRIWLWEYLLQFSFLRPGNPRTDFLCTTLRPIHDCVVQGNLLTPHWAHPIISSAFISVEERKSSIILAPFSSLSSSKPHPSTLQALFNNRFLIYSSFWTPESLALSCTVVGYFHFDPYTPIHFAGNLWMNETITKEKLVRRKKIQKTLYLSISSLTVTLPSLS